MTEPNLRFSAKIFGFLRKSAVFCGFLRPPNARISRRRGESAKICAICVLASLCHISSVPLNAPWLISPGFGGFVWEENLISFFCGFPCFFGGVGGQRGLAILGSKPSPSKCGKFREIQGFLFKKSVAKQKADQGNCWLGSQKTFWDDFLGGWEWPKLICWAGGPCSKIWIPRWRFPPPP